MKFIHIADMHFDKPFTILEKNGLAEKRRLEQRDAFNKMIKYIKENSIDYLFIVGDLYEHEYIRKSTIEYINNSFKEIPNTKIYITPGNHDPYINNSYYSKYNWSENVRIITKLQKFEENEIDIYGYGFTDFFSERIELPSRLNKQKINLLLMHADLNGSNNEIGEYNPILESRLKESEFDYIALGHIHKKNMDDLKMVYPGSMVSGGFDELGSHGMIEGEINNQTKEITIKFISLDNKEFIKQEYDISSIHSEEEIIEKLNSIGTEENKYYEYILIGDKNIEIDTNRILRNIEDKKIIKIKDNSKFKYDLDSISKEKNLRGIFVNEFLAQIKEDESNKDEILKMIEIGLNAM